MIVSLDEIEGIYLNTKRRIEESETNCFIKQAMKSMEIELTYVYH